jgi:hypothetical protein
VIPTPTEMGQLPGIRLVFVPIVFVPIMLALLSTGLVLAAQSIARWFEDRNF